MKPSAFEYHAPATVREAVALLADLHGQDADPKVLAGGQSLIPVLAMRLAAFGHLIDIGRVDGLKGASREDDGWLRIGAGTTHARVGADPAVAACVPLLARATPLIAHFQIRNRGTIGGSIAHADPAAEYPAVALALDAEIEAASAGGARRIPARDFFTGVWSTALDPGELVTGIRFPVRGGRSGFAVREIARRHGDFAVVGAAVAVRLDARDQITSCAIALFGLGSTPVRASAAEAALTGAGAGAADPADAGRAAVAGLGSVPSDLHGTADYRRAAGAVMVSRALAAALGEARAREADGARS